MVGFQARLPRIGIPATLPPRCDPTSDMWFGRRSVASRGNRWGNQSGSRCARCADTGTTGEEPPRREVREYERREYREPAPPYREPPAAYHEPAPGYREPPPAYRESGAAYREAGPLYAPRGPARPLCDRLPDQSYPPPHQPRSVRPLYSVREAEPYGRREIRSSYLAQPHEAGSAYGEGESARRSVRERTPRREEWQADEQNEDGSADEPAAPAWFAVSRQPSLLDA